jgi:hypothetical protein
MARDEKPSPEILPHPIGLKLGLTHRTSIQITNAISLESHGSGVWGELVTICNCENQVAKCF